METLNFIVVNRPDQDYYEIDLNQSVRCHTFEGYSSVIRRKVAELVNPKFYCLWANKSVLFIDKKWFNTLIETNEIPVNSFDGSHKLITV